jgi:hypothetical protein
MALAFSIRYYLPGRGADLSPRGIWEGENGRCFRQILRRVLASLLLVLRGLGGLLPFG